MNFQFMDMLSKDGPMNNEDCQNRTIMNRTKKRLGVLKKQMGLYSEQSDDNGFEGNWNFASSHMPAVRKELALLPVGYFMNFATADAKRDMEEATDLVLEIIGGTMAVRIRRKRYYHFFDWTIRYKIGNNNIKTEIHKLREGFADWYFYGYSADDKSELGFWCLIDLYRVREERLLDRDWSHILKNNTDNKT